MHSFLNLSDPYIRKLLIWEASYIEKVKHEILKDKFPISAPLIFLSMKHNKLNITYLLLTNCFWLNLHVLYVCPEWMYLVESQN